MAAEKNTKPLNDIEKRPHVITGMPKGKGVVQKVDMPLYKPPKRRMTLYAKYTKAIDTLKELEQGKGPYSENHQTFANNVIEAMKNTAKKCLDELGIEREEPKNA